jgi:hypothetical protein
MIGMIGTLAAGIDTLAPESAVAVADSVTQRLIAGLRRCRPRAGRRSRSSPPTTRRDRGVVRERLRDPSFGGRNRRRPQAFASTCTGSGAARLTSDWIGRCGSTRPGLCDPRPAARSISEIASPGAQRCGPLQPARARCRARQRAEAGAAGRRSAGLPSPRRPWRRSVRSLRRPRCRPRTRSESPMPSVVRVSAGWWRGS